MSRSGIILPWDILPGTGDRTVYVRFRDTAGNISSYSATLSVKVYVFMPAILR